MYDQKPQVSNASAQCHCVRLLLSAMIGLGLLVFAATTLARSTAAGDSYWTIETLDSLRDSGLYPSIALDRGGHPHISAYRHADHALRYLYRDGNGWHGETVDGFDGGSVSLALDAQDQPRLAYRSGELRYAAKDSLGRNPLHRVFRRQLCAEIHLYGNDDFSRTDCLGGCRFAGVQAAHCVVTRHGLWVSGLRSGPG